MAVVHFAKVTERCGHTVTGTLCDRMAVGKDGINSTDIRDAVTCKLCLHRLRELRMIDERQTAVRLRSGG